MRSLKFTGADLDIGGTQNQYNTLHAKVVNPKTAEVIIIFELTDDEIAEIVRTRKLVYSRMTLGHPFQPMRIMTQWPDENIPEILPDINSDPKLN